MPAPSEPTPPGSTTRSRLAGTLSWATCVLLCCSLGGLLGRIWWMLDLTSHFRIQYLAVSGLLLLVAVVLRRWIVLLPLSVCVIVNLCLIYPYYVGRPAEVLPGKSVRVMAMNVNAGNRRSQAVREIIADCRPDVLFVLEYNEFWREALAPLESTYRYRRQVPQDDNFGIAVYSQTPWAQAEVFRLPGGGVPAIEVKLVLSEQTLTLVGAHVLPPVSAAASGVRNKQLAALAQRMASTVGPCALLGDLNCTPWSPHFRQLLEVGLLRDSGRGYGVRGTWPLQLPVFMIPIDHCLVSAGLGVVDRAVTVDYGSDHCGLVVDLAAPVRTAEQ